jgi:hypothetical protein
MKHFFCLVAVLLAMATTHGVAQAQGVIYRCGNEYLNDAALAEARGCRVVVNGNVTVIPGTRVHRLEKEVEGPASAAIPVRGVRRSAGVNASSTTDAAAQRVRDSDARSILMDELKTAETRLAGQQKEYNNGEPEKLDLEISNPQRYQERINELKDGINRFSGDIAGLKREIARLPTAVSTSAQ